MNRGYIYHAELRKVPALWPEVLVVGSGVAGLSAAIAAADGGAQVMVLAKGTVRDSNTYHAQGGIAVVLGEGDSIEKHVNDTLEAGAGLCAAAAVESIVGEGPERVNELISWGANFDSENGRLMVGQEGAHSARRILHAEGDRTGMEIQRALSERAGRHPQITVLESVFALDLLHDEGGVWGVIAMDSMGDLLAVYARAVILATGGIGHVYRESTNPDTATGDGIAMAARAGAVLEDMEFVQFHPTTLYLAGVRRHLISEAVRGEGAYLVNTYRERFMPGYDRNAELAPRDVVSRAILSEMKRTNSPHVYLDMRHLAPELVLKRFPNIAATCARYRLDITKDLVPVRPAAHYFMGGIKTDLSGRTSMARLLACGECAATELHGANRLASNSLLEGLVMGSRAGRQACGMADPGRFPRNVVGEQKPDGDAELVNEDMEASLRAMMWRQVGMVRNGEPLASADRALRYWWRYVDSVPVHTAADVTLRNMLTVARFITHAALLREESRGAHYRTDFPKTSEEWRRHQCFRVEDVDSD
ncbi:MAG: L-aspartate oxidase [Planctomycetes bacterium]|nr:L-aspartate oxidase [Planctomycetota bacterium]